MYTYFNDDGHPLVSLETIKVAKSKGFNVIDNGHDSSFYVTKNTRYYKENELTHIYLDETCCDHNPVPENKRLYTCTFYDLQEWLLTNHSMYIIPMINQPNIWGYIIKDTNTLQILFDGNYSFDNIHSAFDAGLMYALTRIYND